MSINSGYFGAFLGPSSLDDFCAFLDCKVFLTFFPAFVVVLFPSPGHDAFLTLYLPGPYDRAKKALKGDVESEDGKKNQEGEENIDLTPHEHESALKNACISFVIPGASKTVIDSYFDQTKPHIKTLIKNQLKDMGSAEIIMIL